MKKIDDLSFSNIVNLIQGDGIKAGDILHNIALEMEEIQQSEADLTNQLWRFSHRKELLMLGAQRVMQHIEKQYPLAVQRQDYIVVVTKDRISIERNVL